MDHREAKGLLLDFVVGDLDQNLRSDVTSHIEACVDCRAWLETHDLLATGSEVGPSSEHPDSEFLALCAVRSAEEDEPGVRKVRQHIEECESCRREMELVRSAVLEARPEGAGSAGKRHPNPSFSWWRAAAAACVVAVAVKVFLPGDTTRRPGHIGVQQTDTTITADELLHAWRGSPGEVFSEDEIEGIRLIEADGSLTMNRVKIKDGAKVTIRAGDAVAFGNGFQIGTKAQVIVEVSQSDPALGNRGLKARKEKSG